MHTLLESHFDAMKQASDHVNHGRFEEAQRLIMTQMANWRRVSPPDNPGISMCFVQLGRLMLKQKQYEVAEDLYQRAIATSDSFIPKKMGPELAHMAKAQALKELADIYETRSELEKAADFRKRSLEEWQKLDGLKEKSGGNSGNAFFADLAHKQRLQAIHELGMIYLHSNRLEEAEALLTNNANENLRIYGLESEETVSAVNTLVELYRQQGRLGEAEIAATGIFETAEKILPASHPLMIALLTNLGLVYMAQGNFADAEKIFTLVGSLSIDEFGDRDPRTITSVNNLAGVYLRQRKFTEAERHYQAVISLSVEVLGADHPETLNRINNLANLYFRQKEWSRAASLWGIATGRLIARSQRGLHSLGQVQSASAQTQAKQQSWQFWSLIKARSRLVQEGKETSRAAARETFRIAQWALSSSAAASLAQMAARGVKGDADLAELIRKRQDLVLEWQRGDAARDAAFSQPAGQRDREAETRNAARLAAIEAEIAVIDRSIAAEFSAYDALVNTQVLSVEEVQSQLAPNEALILFLDTPEWDPTPEETFIWVVTTVGIRWLASPLGTAALTREVQSLRCGLNEDEWLTPTQARRCAGLLGLDAVPDLSRPLPFNLAKAHLLYRGLFEQVEDMTAGKRLLIVSSGPLSILPLHVLVTEAPGAALPDSFESFRGVPWLGRRNAIATLPTVSSLKALRQTAGGRRGASNDYAGYGNPVLRGDGSSCRQHKVPDRCPSPGPGRDEAVQPSPASRMESRATIRGGRGRWTANANTDDVFAKGAAVLEQVRALCPLPDTAYEINCVAERYKGKSPLIRLGAEASERDLKALSDQDGGLASYRILHFATHGLLAGDVEAMAKGQGEPALVLTPPDHPAQAHDDGLLTASEITGLKLNADWVVLSACNTASGGKTGGESLSGLARAFFYAGARSLLVSHWPVYSDAAVRLTTRSFAAFEGKPAMGQAEALQSAMMSLMDDEAQPDNAHPAVWAPFVIVGDGAR